MQRFTAAIVLSIVAHAAAPVMAQSAQGSTPAATQDGDKEVDLVAYKVLVRQYVDSMRSLLKDAHNAIEATKRIPRPGSATNYSSGSGFNVISGNTAPTTKKEQKAEKEKIAALTQAADAARKQLVKSIAEARRNDAKSLLTVKTSALPAHAINLANDYKACAISELASLDEIAQLLAISGSQRFASIEKAGSKFSLIAEPSSQSKITPTSRAGLTKAILDLPSSTPGIAGP